jgi:hypothetical protein
MIEKMIKLYEYSELSQQAKEKARATWNESNDDPFMQSNMINILKEKLDEKDIKYDTDSIDVRYSLSNSQGDGFMFLGEIYWKQYTVYIKHDGSRYFHSNTAQIEIQETENLGFHMDDEHADVKEFNSIYQTICEEMERIGYDEIEHQQSEEMFENQCTANEWTFREDGTLETV